MTFLLVILLCLAGCVDSTSRNWRVSTGDETQRLTFSEVLNGAQWAGLVSRLEVAEHETVCVHEPDVQSILRNGHGVQEVCFWSLVGSQAAFYELLVEKLSTLVLDNQCDIGITEFIFSRPEGGISKLYIPGHKHLLFYGLDYGWILMPVSNEAANHVMSGEFCQAPD